MYSFSGNTIGFDLVTLTLKFGIYFCVACEVIGTHRDHFVHRLSVCPSVCPSVMSVHNSVTLAELCFAGDTCIPRNAATIFLNNVAKAS